MPLLCLRWWRSCEDAWLAACVWVELALFCGAACIAEACCTDTKSAGVPASKRHRTIRFTALLPREIPCEAIESQVAEKVSENRFQSVPRINRRRPAVIAELLFFGCDKNRETSHGSTERARLTAELEPFEPLDGLALAGNDLRLPYQGDGHEAQGKNAKSENEVDGGLVSRKAENAPKPSHGKGSPSTRFDLLALVPANPS